MFIVTFFNIAEQTYEGFEYDGLLDAITVAKNFEINNRPAISNERFTEELLKLLVGKKVASDNGEYNVQIVNRNGSPVYGPEIIPFVASVIPSQTSPVATPTEPYTMMKWIGEPEADVSNGWVDQFVNPPVAESNSDA